MSEEMKQVPIDLSHVFELLSNKKNDILNIDYSNDNDSYPTVRAVKNYVDDLQTILDSKASTADLIGGLQHIGAFTIHTVYNVNGSTSAFDVSSGLSYAQQTPVFFLVKNNIGDNEANATLKYYPNGNNIPIIDTFSSTSHSRIQQGVWKKDTWALFFCYGNSSEVQLRCVFYDSVNINEIMNKLSILITGKEDKSNKVTSLSSSSTDTQYPSAKCVYDAVDIIDDKVSVVYNTVSIIDTSDSVYDADRWTEYGSMSIGRRSKDKFIGGGNSGYVIYDGNISNLDNYDITLNLQANRKNTNLYINDDDNIGTLPTSQTSILFKKRDGVVKVVYDNNQYDASAVKIVAFNIMSLIRYTIDVVLYQGMIYDVIDSIPSKTSDLTNDSGYLTAHQNISGKEDKSNKVTSLSSSSTDTEYPSAKIVYDSLQEISKNITFEATFKERTTEQVWVSAYATKLVFTCNTLTDNDLNKNFRVKLNLNSSSIQNINNMVIIVLESTNLSNDFEAKLVNRRLGDEYEMNLLNCDWIITEKTNGNYNVYSYQLNYGLNLLNSNSPYAIVDNLITNDATKVLSARQGKVLNDLIGDAITYINGTGGN